MASISNDPGGRRRILFVDPSGDRKAIRLGKVSQRTAEGFKYRIEQLLEALMFNRSMEADLAQWVNDLEADLADKLARVGLIPSREAKAVTTLGPFLDAYLAKRIDVKGATKEIWGHTIRNLNDFLGAERDLTTITEGDAEDFKLYLIGDKLAPTTISKRPSFARQFFRDAWKRKLITANPFLEVAAKATMRSDRQRFVTREETKAILAVCDPTWRLIVSLSRFGGLRCPSEVLSVRWQDVDWETGRIVVQSPKTEHHVGKDSRPLPMFPELRTILADAFDAAPEGAEYVIGGGYREAANTESGWRNCNLRTQFLRIIKRAGLKPWPRLFHNLRASRETELVRDYPIHVVTAWLGNTPQIAMKHYLQVTEADYQKANDGGAENGAQAAQNEAQQAHAGNRGDSHEQSATPLECAAIATSCDTQLVDTKSLSGEDRIRLSPFRKRKQQTHL